MTLSDIQEEVYEFIGEPSDLYDTNATPAYSQKLPDAINEGQRQVASWRDPATKLTARFPSLTSQSYFQTYYLSDDLKTEDEAHTTTIVILPADSFGADTATLATDDVFNGWSITIASETRRIVDYEGSTRKATLHEALTAAPSEGSAYELSKNYMDILASGHAQVAYNILRPANFLLPLKILDLANERELEEGSRDEDFVNLIGTTSDPTQFIHRNERILFDFVPDEARWYYMEYSKLPAEMVETTDEPDLPENFHFGIVLLARWWGYAREQGLEAAWAGKKDFVDFMRQTVGMYYTQSDRRQVHGIVRTK